MSTSSALCNYKQKCMGGQINHVLHGVLLSQVVWLVTCVASILLGLDLGLAVGLGIELLTVVFRTQL